MPNELIFQPTSSSDLYNSTTGSSFFAFGDTSGTNRNGAIRFRNVTIPQGTTISRAGLYVFDSLFGGSGTIRATLSGIDEDNTSDFSGDPFGRSRTSATTNSDTNAGATSWDIDITGIVQEIINRGGWSSGNNLGIIAEDNGSDNDCYVGDGIGGSDNCLLSIRVTNPNLTPTPVEVAAPTFPATLGYGMKISQSGINVHTATESQLLYTSDKEYLKVLAEDEIETTANTQYLIAHGLDHTPEGMAFVRADGKSFELPRLFGGVTDPITGGVQGYFSLDGTNMRIITTTNATVYYYIFRDSQP